MSKQPRVIGGQVAAITGGARGIGQATAQALVQEGMRVAIGDLDLERARATAEQLGGGTVAFELDVTDRASFERFVDEAEGALGPLDVLVNNAGIMPIGCFTEEDDLTAARMVDINCHGVVYGMKIVLPRFEARGRGHLVNIASTAGKGGFPGGATYCGTKHFVVGVSEAVRAELSETEIEVSCVMPGVVNTELADGLVEGRGVKKVEPGDVAAEIVSALKQPRFDVFVPRSIGPITKVLNVLPRAGREAVARFLKADQILLEADPDARREYERRAAQSEPGLEAGGETPEKIAG
ncbi:MAG: SDR family oxidoreductase [Thermoleophilaceae bacterium]